MAKVSRLILSQIEKILMSKLFNSLFFCLVILFFGAATQAQKFDVDSLLPILGNYENKSVPLGGSLTASPETGASNIGTATVTVSGNFKGSITVSPSSGAVRVLNAYPAGNYTVTVRASDFAGFTVTRSFTLTVTNVSSCNTLDFAGIRATVGINPQGFVAADFNGDGRQDVATANNGSNNISVLLGNGAGSFGTVTNFALTDGAISPSSLAVGDFNGDNKADLAVRTTLFGNVSHISVFSGTGTGNFSAPVNYSLGSTNPNSFIAVGDFNGDGRQDIAIIYTNTPNLAILFRNAANNGFDAAVNINLGFTTTAIAAADFNADGRHDLVVNRNASNMVTALIRNGANNGFDQVNLTVNGSSGQVVVGDFTGDGRQDIAVSHPSGLDILPRNALGFDGAISAGFSLGSTLQIGDFNNDGRLDIAGLSGSQAIVAYRNAANTNFDSPVNIGGTGFQVIALAAADFNNDGRADLAALNFVFNVAGSVSVLRRNGTNTNFDLSPVQTLGSTSFTDTALGDFDNDGRQDLATATLNSTNIAIQKGSAGGVFTNLTNAVLNGGNVSNGVIIAADFNNDGNTDLIVGNSTINGFSLLQGAGNGSFAAAIDFSIGSPPLRFAVGDFNGDGRQDLAVNRQGSNQTLIYLRNSANSGFETPVTISQSATVNALTVGDFNNDGNDDFAVSFFNISSFSVILRNAANNGFDAPVSYAANLNGQITAADFDADGNLDIAYGTNDVAVYYGSATGTFGAPTGYGGNMTAGYVESGDFNGDGRQDIVTATSNYNGVNGRANVVVLLRNAANNGFDAPVGFNGSYIINNSLTQKILVGEVNGDGRQDLITANGFSGSLQSNFSVMPRVCAVDLNLLGALPNGTAGQFYSKTIYGNGGIAPYNFTVSGLPGGLNFTTTSDSVTIFGMPINGGRFDISVGISDSSPLAELPANQFAPQAANQLTQVLPLQINFIPTAANVSISGKIFAADGNAVSGATVVLTNQNGLSRTLRSNSFGIFRFDEVEIGQVYVVSIKSKGSRFASRVISVADEITDLNFTAIE